MASAERLEARVEIGPGFDTLLDERWDALNRASPVPNPLLASRWLGELGARAPGTPLVAAVEREGRLVAGGAFRVTGPPGLRVADTLGAGFAVHRQDVLLDGGIAGAADVLAAALLEAVDAASVECARSCGLADALLGRAPWGRTLPAIQSWHATLPPSRLAYADRRSSYGLRRAARAGARIETVVAAEPDEIAPALERLLALHRERWAERRDALPLLSATPAQRDFYRAAVAGLAATGDVRIVELRDRGNVVFSALVLLCGRAACCHGTAFRPSELREPGHVGMLAVAAAAREAGAEVLDLGRGSGEPGGRSTASARPRRRLSRSTPLRRERGNRCSAPPGRCASFRSRRPPSGSLERGTDPHGALTDSTSSSLRARSTVRLRP